MPGDRSGVLFSLPLLARGSRRRTDVRPLVASVGRSFLLYFCRLDACDVEISDGGGAGRQAVERKDDGLCRRPRQRSASTWTIQCRSEAILLGDELRRAGIGRHWHPYVVSGA